MSGLLEEVAKSPRLPFFVDHWQQLLSGERERRREFRDGLSPSVKAEYINGQVIMHSPAKLRHTNVVKFLLKLLDTHVEHRRLGWVGHEKVLVCLTRNDYEPDLVFYGREKAAALRPDQMEFPAPDLIIEVLSESTEDRDRGVKMDDYAAHQVKEYLLVDPARETIEQYELTGDQFSLRFKADSGVWRSIVVENFEIPVRAAFDAAVNLETLQRLATAAAPEDRR